MKANKLLVTAVALGLAQMASANVVTDAGTAVVDGVQAVGSTAWDSTKTVAKTVANPGAVSLEVGTLGYGASFTWSANEKTEVVAGWNGGNFNADIDMQDSYINWNKVLSSEFQDFQGQLRLDADLSNPYLGVNVRPWANNFYVGTGIIFQDNSFNGTLTANEGQQSTVNIKGQDVPVEKVQVFAEPSRKLAPYLTLGFKPSTDKNWGMFGEVGAAYAGDMKIRAVVNDDPTSATSQDLTDDIGDSGISWYPIAKIGATYRF